jgi:hypothetical protein
MDMVRCVKGDWNGSRTDKIDCFTVIPYLTRYEEDVEVGNNPVMHEVCQLPDMGVVC